MNHRHTQMLAFVIGYNSNRLFLSPFAPSGSSSQYMRLFVDNLTNVDFSYLCPIRGLVGETWLAHVELTGELDNQGMVCDFGTVKKSLRNWLDDQLDHRLLVPADHPQVNHKEDGEDIDIEFTLTPKAAPETIIRTRSPRDSVTLVDTTTINPESVAQWCINSLTGLFGTAIQEIRLTFTPEVIDGPYYHYSHGLKKHKGNCQRIAHGHRSRILIWRNDVLCRDTMQYWADKWQDVYIASNEDCIDKTPYSASFAYTSQQGPFQLTLPLQQCYFIDTDTTVEFIAQHLADQISQQHPGERITVKAFEGIAKGAIAQA